MATQSFSVRLPKEIIFGAGKASQILDVLPSGTKNVLFVRGKHPDKAIDGLEKLLSEKFSVKTFLGVPPEPSPEDVDEIVNAGRLHKADAVVAAGGGSVMDGAKAAAAIIPADGNCEKYFSGGEAIRKKGLFFAALPTTSGTGAEMTNNSVLTCRRTLVKKSLRSPYMTADAAIVDPVLTLSCPERVTASSGLDAFVQAVESYTSSRSSVFSRALAVLAAKKIFSSLEKACKNPDDLEARSLVAEGSMLCGMSFAQCGLGAVHGIAHPAGSLLHVPHGVACAVLMPYVFEFNKSACARAYGEMAVAIGLPDAEKMNDEDKAELFVREVKKLNQRLLVPPDLKKYGIGREHFDFIVKNCRSASMKSNPREMSDADVVAILEKLV